MKWKTWAVLLWIALSTPVRAQHPAVPLIVQSIDETKLVTLRGTVHPLAQARFDRGAVADSFAANRMLLLLNRPAEREAALRQFLNDVHIPASSNYHQWLTPEEFGARFGPADSDIQAAVSWLTAYGFKVARTTAGKSLMEFSGTAKQVREVFHAEIHRYQIENEMHYANSSDLAIPEALAPVVRGVSPINNFRIRPLVRHVGPAGYSRSPHQTTPLFTNPGGSTNFFAIAPEDFATQYNVAPLYAAGITGAGQTIGIIGESNIDVSLVNAYRQLFGLSSNAAQIVIDGGDPGIDPLPSSALEAYLDVELSGAVAPNATVSLYISDGSQVQDPKTLAAVRAVEDNQASVLSASFESCEAALGAGGNQMWFGLWEQAAAQGQTVLVGSGDSGPADCDAMSAPFATQGLAVNGIAATPWNVAVGGTDFYYSNYAAGISAATPFWNATNDSSSGSLKASLPEQPWDAAFGLNIFSNTGTILGGGGGASSCANSTTGALGQTVCVSGYPKPIWQTAPGVPSDGVRDLPDVSLFAAAGSNGSAYAICAADGECAPTAGSQAEVLLVGGTSASTPAMAGLMALVNQKYGRQGQADFTLYALARQQPAVFHDLTKGTNNVPCQQGSPDCTQDTTGDGLFSLQKYSAGPGYDLAGGLGSVDANALVTNWDKISFQTTATTLSLSPTSIVHGTSVNFAASVAATSGSATPTGVVAISTSSGFPLQMSEAIPLSNGMASKSVGFFPGGTYQVSAEYGGDGVFGPSTSAPVSLTVTSEPSSIWSVVYGPAGPLINGGTQAGYGFRWVFTGEPYGMNGQQLFGLATGAITFTDGTNVQTVPINEEGVAGYSPSTLSVGTHSITLNYAGDGSYQPSSAGPFVFTIGKGDPAPVIPFIEPSVPLGGNLVLSAALGTGFGTPPTGNVSFSLGTTTVMAPLVAANYAGYPHAIATATLTNLQSAGSFTLGVNYGGDSNWTSATTTYPSPIVVAASARAATSISLSVSPTAISRFESTSFVATVQSATGGSPAPTGTVLFYVNGQALPGNLAQTGPATSIASPSGAIPALALSNGDNPVVAVYSGDAVYNPSTSTAATVTANLETFSVSLGAPRVVISAGKSGSVPIVLTAIGGFSMALSLSCVPSSGSIGCSVNPPTPAVSGNTVATLNINAFMVTQSAALTTPTQAGGSSRPMPIAGIFAMLFVMALSFLRRSNDEESRAKVAICCCLVFALVAAGCGGGGIVSPPPPPPPTITPAPVGSYSVVVTATANSTVHNVKLTVIVQ